MTPAPLARADCERVREGLVGQPANAASCLAYLGAGAALIARARRTPPGRRAWLGAFGLATAANGAGGVAYHGPGGAASRWLHDAALLSTLGLMACADATHLAGHTRWRSGALGAVAAGAVLAAAPGVSTAAQVATGAAVVAGEAATGIADRRRADRDEPGPGAGPRRRFGPLALAGAAAVTVYAASRTGRPLCRPDSLLQGHAAWHALTAAMLWWWGREVLGGQLVMPPRPTRPRASSTSPM